MSLSTAGSLARRVWQGFCSDVSEVTARAAEQAAALPANTRAIATTVAARAKSAFGDLKNFAQTSASSARTTSSGSAPTLLPLGPLTTPLECYKELSRVVGTYRGLVGTSQQPSPLANRFTHSIQDDPQAFNAQKAILIEDMRQINGLRHQIFEIAKAYENKKLSQQVKEYEDIAPKIGNLLETFAKSESEFIQLIAKFTIKFQVAHKELEHLPEKNATKCSPLFKLLVIQHPTATLFALSLLATYYIPPIFGGTAAPASNVAAASATLNATNSNASGQLLASVAEKASSFLWRWSIPLAAGSCAFALDNIKKLPEDAGLLLKKSIEDFVPIYLSNSLLIGGLLAGNSFWHDQPCTNIMWMHTTAGTGYFLYSNYHYVSEKLFPFLKMTATLIEDLAASYFKYGWETGVPVSLGIGIATQSTMLGAVTYGAHLFASGIVKLAHS